MTAPVRWSNLRWMRQSPAHYLHHLKNPSPPTAAMRIGAYAHRLALGGPRPFCTYDGIRRGKDWEAFKELAELDSLEIVSTAEAAAAEGCAEALRLHPIAGNMLDEARSEVPVAWTMAGRECRGTVDLIGRDWIAEVKVTDANPNRLPWQAQKMGWLGQLAWYAAGVTPMESLSLYIIAVEPKPPHPVTVMCLTEAAREAGERLWNSLFNQLLVCEASDDWPAYTSAVLPLDVPGDEDVTLSIDGDEVTL